MTLFIKCDIVFISRYDRTTDIHDNYRQRHCPFLQYTILLPIVSRDSGNASYTIFFLFTIKHFSDNRNKGIENAERYSKQRYWKRKLSFCHEYIFFMSWVYIFSCHEYIFFKLSFCHEIYFLSHHHMSKIQHVHYFSIINLIRFLVSHVQITSSKCLQFYRNMQIIQDCATESLLSINR